MSYFTQAHQRWWHPLVEILLVVVLWPIVVTIGLGGIELVAWQLGSGGIIDRGFAEPMDMHRVECCVVMLVLLASGLPASMIVARIVRRRRWKSLVALGGRFDRKFFLTGVAIVLPLSLVFVSALYLVGPERSARVNWQLLLVCLALVPVQSMAEELIFRGILAQAIGTWTRSWVAAVLIPLPFFVLGHDYSWMGLLAIAWFAACAGFLAQRTHGLAGPMALHVGNNLGFFMFGAVGLSDLNQSQISAVEAGIDVVFCTLATTILCYLYRTQQKQCDLIASHVGESHEEFPLLDAGYLVAKP